MMKNFFFDRALTYVDYSDEVLIFFVLRMCYSGGGFFVYSVIKSLSPFKKLPE